MTEAPRLLARRPQNERATCVYRFVGGRYAWNCCRTIDCCRTISEIISNFYFFQKIKFFLRHFFSQ